MHSRFILVVFGSLFLMSYGISQTPVYTPSEVPGAIDWGNPYPGLGNVTPGSAVERSSASSAITLFADNSDVEHNAELPATIKSTELYLSRFPSKKRTGIFQKINFNTLWAPASGSKGLGITELDLSAMFALPMPTADSPLLITPKFTTDFFDAEETALRGNETFYTTGLDLRWVRPICKNKLTADLGLGIFYSGDFRADSSDSLRFPAHAAGIWNLNPRTKILFGIIYTDRSDDYTWLPMVGVIWTPNDDLSVELVVPRLRIAQRVRWFGSASGDEQSDWIYTAFEFGGGEWGYEYDRELSKSCKVDYQDLRLLFGYERRTQCGAMIGLELGYMFERELEFVGYGTQDISDTVFLRLRSSF